MRRKLVIAVALVPAIARAQQQAPTPSKPELRETVTVTADRGLLGTENAATSTVTLSPEQLQNAPALTLDDRLHQAAGFTLFRRTSSATANPTTEGISLRGLGSTAASRTLVVSDQVPMNDPFGGWIHWDEIPTIAIESVSLERGGASDLYGSSAIGGVIDLVPASVYTLVPPPPPPPPDQLDTKRRFPSLTLTADGSGATENSANEDALMAWKPSRLGLLGAFSGLNTGGYIPTAPSQRGPVDIPANVKAKSGRTELERFFDVVPGIDTIYTFLRGNILNESRSNGTPLQTNATRLWRYQSGADYDGVDQHVSLRLFGSRESYRQSFSSINAARTAETLTKLQRVPLDELGFALQTSHSFHSIVIVALGLDAHDIRATDNETAVATSVLISISAHQRELGGFADALWQPQHWLISASIRADSYRTFDAQQALSNSATVTHLPELDELFASPHLGIVRTLGDHAGLTANAFRAFRAPTMNELYRTGQVGSQTTLANNTLLAERATGFEFGGFFQAAHFLNLRASYFWTEVNRPVSAVLLSQTATTQTLQRQNLGQLRSRGLSLDARTLAFHGFDASFGYQLAIATVTAFNSGSPVQPPLLGKWLPEVPRNAATATVNYTNERLASAHLIASYNGRTWDDALNTALLHPYPRLDLTVDRAIRHNLTLFAASQNLLNRTIDAGLTPNLTLAAPRLVQAGLRFSFTH